MTGRASRCSPLIAQMPGCLWQLSADRDDPSLVRFKLGTRYRTTLVTHISRSPQDFIDNAMTSGVTLDWWRDLPRAATCSRARLAARCVEARLYALSRFARCPGVVKFSSFFCLWKARRHLQRRPLEERLLGNKATAGLGPVPETGGLNASVGLYFLGAKRPKSDCRF